MWQALTHSKLSTKSRRKLNTAFDNAMYVVALATPLLTVPQLLVVWLEHKTAGVSLVTWVAYTVASGIWLVYGLVKGQKPIIIAQACIFVIDLGVICGVFIFR